MPVFAIIQTHSMEDAGYRCGCDSHQNSCNYESCQNGSSGKSQLSAIGDRTENMADSPKYFYSDGSYNTNNNYVQVCIFVDRIHTYITTQFQSTIR